MTKSAREGRDTWEQEPCELNLKVEHFFKFNMYNVKSQNKAYKNQTNMKNLLIISYRE
jgi:hypothetical protein